MIKIKKRFKSENLTTIKRTFGIFKIDSKLKSIKINLENFIIRIKK